MINVIASRAGRASDVVTSAFGNAIPAGSLIEDSKSIEK